MSINVLHIDDKQEVATYLDEISQAHEEDLIIHWYDTFDKGVAALKEKPFFFNGIILDAKCFLNEEEGVLDEKNVLKAIFEIEGIFKSYNYWLPYCILSGFKDKLDREIQIFNLTAFDKNSDEEAAINFLVKEQVKVNRHNLDKKYPGIIELSEDGFLLSHDISTILMLYSSVKLSTDNRGIIKAQVAQTRPILERIILKLEELGEIDGERVIPDGAVGRMNGNEKTKYLTECFKYLAGIPINSFIDTNIRIERNALMPSYISWQCTSIYNVASDIANHANQNTGSKYTLEGLFNSLIDVLYWYKNFMETYS